MNTSRINAWLSDLDDSVVQDVRHTLRLLRRSPGFAAVAILVLALGIGASSSVFGLIDAAILRPLPYTAPERLVLVSEQSPTGLRARVSPLNFLDWIERGRTLTSLSAIATSSRVFTQGQGIPEQLPGQSVTTDFFEMLGVRPILGRTFAPEDANPGTNLAVIGEGLWRSRFGADHGLIGGTITLDGQSFTVIGVVPAYFRFLTPAQVWTVLRINRGASRGMRYLQVIGRIGPSAGLAQVQADMTSVAESIAQVAPETKGWTIRVESLQHAVVGDELRGTTYLLASVVALVLLLACANVANMVLSRNIGRTKEFAIRAAMGGGRRRIVRQLLTESFVLAGLGGMAGLALAWLILRGAPSALPAGTLPESVIVGFDTRVGVIGALLTLAAAAICGVLPARQATSESLSSALSASGRSATRHSGLYRTALAVVQIVISVVILIGSGLLIRTLVALSSVDAGHSAGEVLTMKLALPFARYDPDRARTLYESLERDIRSLPGVRAAAIGGDLPLDGLAYRQSFQVIGEPPGGREHQTLAQYQIVSPRYFNTLRIPLVAGRPFDEQDRTTARQVCIVDERFVRRHLSGREPIGASISVQAMSLGGPSAVIREIVGVVKHVKASPEEEDLVQIYVPVAQNPWYAASILVRSDSNPALLLAPVAAVVARHDGLLPLTQARTVEEIAEQATSRPRFRMLLVLSFGLLALTLATIGVFGVLALSVQQRLREFGMRLALGATRSHILRLVFAHCLRITLSGVAIGAIGAVALSRFMTTLLFNVEPFDAPTFLVVVGVVVAAALIACTIPALRAVRCDPASALRLE